MSNAEWTRTFLLGLLLVWLPPLLAQSPETRGPGASREYFVRQRADDPLVIRVNPFEAEFTVQVTGPNGELLGESGIPGNRTQPVFVYIDSVGKERQLDIRVESVWQTRRTRFELEFSRLDIRDDLSTDLARAQQRLAYGHEVLTVDTAANWSVKVNMLMQASRAFQDFGMEELRLWSALSAAHVAWLKLGDSTTALQLNESVLGAAQVAGLETVSLSAVMMRGEILAAMAESMSAADRIRDESQTVLAAAGEFARRLDYRYEQAYSEFLRGKELAGRERGDEALVRFGSALEIALDLQAMTLATEIRERMVEIHERHGDRLASEAVLGDVVSQLASEGAQDELVRSLLQQAALYLDLYRYPEAIDGLQEALAIDNVSLTQTQAALMLGQAWFESGRFAAAEQQLTAAVLNPGTGVFRRPNPLLPIEQGLGTLATLARHRGDAMEAERVRKVQSRHLEGAASRARWAYEDILDRLAAGRAVGAQWQELRRAIRAGGGEVLEALAQLAFCSADAGAGCTDETTRAALARVQSRGNPREAVAAGWHYYRFLVRSGRLQLAGETLEALLDEVFFLRQDLPGVLGSWFWLNRAELFSAALDVSGLPAASSDLRSLLRLAKVRAIEQVMPSGALHEDVRAGLNQPGADRQAVVAGLRTDFKARHGWLSLQGIQTYLDQLADDEGVLAIDLDGRSAQIWLAQRGTVKRRDLRVSAELDRALDRIRTAGQDTDASTLRAALERAGRELLGPVQGDLPQTVYWLPAGSLLGIPLDSLVLSSGVLGARHRIVGVLDFPASPPPGRRLDMSAPERVFAAGYPTDWTARFPDRLETTPELTDVAGRFIGPGLHIVQGNALLPHEFADPRVGAAQLLHLAMPVRIELGAPEESRFELSEPGRGEGRAGLMPEDVRRWRLSAQLLVLTQSGLHGRGADRFDARFGLAGELLRAGAQAVLISDQPLGAKGGAWFSSMFYPALERSGDIAAALEETRAAQRGENAPEAVRNTAFQLLIR